MSIRAVLNLAVVVTMSASCFHHAWESIKHMLKIKIKGCDSCKPTCKPNFFHS